MLPLRDANRSSTWPLVTFGLIVLNALAFFYELGQGDRLDQFLLDYGLVPVKVVYFGRIAGLDLLGDVAVPALASIFLHGGWLHLLGNMWFLWIFGDNVEDCLGHFRFALFYLLAGLAGGAAQVFASPQSGVPIIGASGAIAGVLGAYMIRFPRARILTLVPIFVFIQFVELPAFVVLLFWFALQFFNGTLAIASQMGGGVAWWAHIGGFAAGMAMILVFPNRRRRVQYRS
jgi:membrane associated rhomboid family serine protease